MRRSALLAAALAAAPLANLPAHAQTATVGGGAVFETYRFSDAEKIDIDALTLLTTPFGATVRFTRAVSLQVSGAWARGELERPDGSGATISGLTDTDVRLSATLGRDAVTITAIAQLPTGVAELTEREADAAGMFAADVLPFRVTNWGAGGGLGLSTAVAQPVGEFALGLAAGYVVAREFEPVVGSAQYRPGNQLHITGAIDRTFGTSGKASLSVTYQRFGEDEADGANLFRTGDRIQALGSYAFATGPTGSGVVYGGYLHRARGEFIGLNEFDPSRGLVFAGAGLRLPAGTAVLQPAVDLRAQTGDGPAGFTLGVGGSAELPLGASVRLVPTVRGRFGNVELATGSSSGFAGAEAGLLVRF